MPTKNEVDSSRDTKNVIVKAGKGGDGGGKRGGRNRKALQKMVIDSDDESAGGSGSEYEMSEEEESEEDFEMDGVEESDSEEEEYAESDDSNKNRKKKSAKKAQSGKYHAETPSVAVNTKVQITPSSFTTPGSVSKRLREVLDGSTPGSGTELVGIESPGLLQSASRFMQREISRFPFLQADKIRDAQKRRPDDPEYDGTTLYIPQDWFKANKISEGQKQWWDFKARHFDCVLLFKMGKFYEMFEMDAHIGAECLGLSYMKGEQPHCGFPEAAYAQMAERLARAGHRVVVIEQTETPDMLAARNQERKKKGLKRDTVVMREKVAVISRATITDADMMIAAADNEYLVSIADMTSDVDDGAACPCVAVGIVAVDVASGRVVLGQFEDDELRSHLRAVLTALRPVEVVIPRGETYLSVPSRKVIKGVLRSPLIDERAVGDKEENFLTGELFWQLVDEQEYFTEILPKPKLLSSIESDKEKFKALCFSLGGCLGHLKRLMLDKRVLCTSRFQMIDQVLGQLGRITTDAMKNPVAQETMALDGAALENLEILENGEGGISGTLLGAIDHCVTPFGRRRLREWLCRPLFSIEKIRRRQDAVQDLMTSAEEAAGEARKLLAGLTDIERAIARLCASGAGVGSLRDSPRVILYEDVSKKKIKSMLATLNDIQKTISAVKAFNSSEIESEYLRQLVSVNNGSFPDIETPLNELFKFIDWKEAEASGRINPAEGVDEAYDAAQQKVKEARQQLDSYLDKVQLEIKGGSKVLRYTSLNKEPFVLEAPENVEVPHQWETMQGKKGFKRYITNELRQLSSNLSRATEEKEFAQTKILQSAMRKFSEHKDLWVAAVEAIADLDALMSLAKSAACSAGPMCRPEFLSWNEGQQGSPIFRAKGLRHPAGLDGGQGNFVPNDVCLGGDSNPTFTVLTGPNMGGKSTLMRQVCLATVAAQIGAWIPAEELELSPVDAVFVRMGAKDHIMLGQSTFFVELSETAAALRRATYNSLVALDELGRGTATSDGSAIAAAVLEHLAHTIKCRGIFATHYHNVADAYSNDPQISIQHMACAVRESDDNSGVDDVVFLYQLSKGACPKSYGANVAKLAGLPHNVVTRAVHVSQELHEVAKDGSSLPYNPKDSADIISLQMRAKLACKAYATHPSSETKKEMIDTISSISLGLK